MPPNCEVVNRTAPFAAFTITAAWKLPTQYVSFRAGGEATSTSIREFSPPARSSTHSGDTEIPSVVISLARNALAISSSAASAYRPAWRGGSAKGLVGADGEADCADACSPKAHMHKHNVTTATNNLPQQSQSQLPFPRTQGIIVVPLTS